MDRIKLYVFMQKRERLPQNPLIQIVKQSGMERQSIVATFSKNDLLSVIGWLQDINWISYAIIEDDENLVMAGQKYP